MQSEGNTFWMQGYLPNGCRVSFTMTTTPETAYADALAFTNAMLAQGLTTHEPGLEPGQKREPISQIVIGRKQDGIPFADLYPADGKLVNRVTRVYFDVNSEQTSTFEQHSGYVLANTPADKVWKRKEPIKRNENPDDDRYLITLPRPVNVVLEQNPDYVAPQPGQMGTTRRWYVLRFEPLSDTPTPAPAANPYAPKADAPLATTIVIRESKDKKPYLTVLGANNQLLGVTPTRKIFTDAGYDTNAWTGINSRHELNPPAVITAEIVSNALTVTSVAKAA